MYDDQSPAAWFCTFHELMYFPLYPFQLLVFLKIKTLNESKYKNVDQLYSSQYSSTFITHQWQWLLLVSYAANILCYEFFPSVLCNWICLHKVVCKTNIVLFQDVLYEYASYAEGCFFWFWIECHILDTWTALLQLQQFSCCCLCTINNSVQNSSTCHFWFCFKNIYKCTNIEYAECFISFPASFNSQNPNNMSDCVMNSIGVFDSTTLLYRVF